MNSDLSVNNVIVTVGMCVKNSEATLKEAIESVLDQDFPHESMELVVVDGCSQDKTLMILRDSLKKTDIRTKVFYENEGLGRARQIVVENASGEYIVWVDGDMVLSRDFARRQVEFMNKNPEVGIAKGKYGTRTNGKNENLVSTLENVEFMLNTMFEGRTSSKSLGTSGCIYRVEAIRQVGGFDPYIKGVGEDMDSENRIRKAGWLLHITSALFYETRRQTWKSLWNEYYWHGRGGRRLFEKNKRIINLYKMLPPVALTAELFRVSDAYRLTHCKGVLFLPFHYAFKRVAWFLGFVKSFLEKRENKLAL